MCQPAAARVTELLRLVVSQLSTLLADFLGRVGRVDRYDVTAGASRLDPAKVSGVVVG